jgi:isopentenyl-diphosphate delta-isomerase
MSETTAQFEARKQDHIRIALSDQVQAKSLSGLSDISLIHEALPEIDFSEVSLASDLFGRPMKTPFFISSMTAGHSQGLPLNLIFAKAAQKRGWPMAVGSQRRELKDFEAANEWKQIRKEVPGLVLLGNLGLSQLIHTPLSEVERLIDTMEAQAFFIHSNPLQECLQGEGTPQFKGGLDALKRLCKVSKVPIVFKETGCGISKQTLHLLEDSGVAAVDVAGLGGTHWGRVEGYRSGPGQLLYNTAQTFANWGISTVHSVLSAKETGAKYQVWASGGVRSGLDAAKLLALGADKVGLAQPLLQSAVQGLESLEACMEQLEYELKVALFCTGQKSVGDRPSQQIWAWTNGQDLK